MKSYRPMNAREVKRRAFWMCWNRWALFIFEWVLIASALVAFLYWLFFQLGDMYLKP